MCKFDHWSSFSCVQSCWVSVSCLCNCTFLALCRSGVFSLPTHPTDAHIHICSPLLSREITNWCTDGDFQEGKLNYFVPPRNTWAHWRGWQSHHPLTDLSESRDECGVRRVWMTEGQFPCLLTGCLWAWQAASETSPKRHFFFKEFFLSVTNFGNSKPAIRAASLWQHDIALVAIKVRCVTTLHSTSVC